MSEGLDAHLDRVLIGGREHRPIVVVPPDPAWPARFAAERARIARVLADVARGIEHIGSTAVPGLAAKPVIDVLVTVDDVEAEDGYVPALEAAGYVLRVREPRHRMLRTPSRDVHVHVWPAGADEVRRYLLLRDWLRASAADRALYAETKQELARRDWPDMNHYAEAKTPVVSAILARAEAWDEAGRPARG